MQSALRRSAVPWLVALVVVCTLELWIVQEQVLVAFFKTPEMLRTRQLFRLGLDLVVMALLVFHLPRPALVGVWVTQAVVFVLGGIYHDHYGRLPRLAMLTGQAGEGAAISDLVVGMIRPGLAIPFLAALAVKCALLVGARRAEEGAPRVLKRWVLAGGVGVYASLFTIANLTFDPLAQIKGWGSATRFGMTYGFVVPMVAEAHYTKSQSLLKRALANAATSTDRLTPLEASLPVRDRVVFLQVETLDWGIIGHRVNGVEVTPNLNRLRDVSMFYKAEAAHATGSADADFVALMGKWPSRDIVTYKIADYPFGPSLPRALTRQGFNTVALHGVSGSFFNRREAFTKMGFSQVHFREELAARGVPGRHEKYDWIQDAELLAFAAEQLRAAPTPLFQMIITVTSHSPFQELPPDERAKCGPSTAPYDLYVCSIRYVDRAIGKFIDRLPEGTTLVLYGDHNSPLARPDYDSGRRGDRDWVPVFIYDHPGGLARAQTTGTRALDGSLTFVDVMRYVHRQVLDRPRTTASR